MSEIDPPRLFRVWMNKEFTTAEVACVLNISVGKLYKLARQHKLPRRDFAAKAKDHDQREPTPEQVAEYAVRAAECRERHFAMRRGEDEETTRTKVWKWRQKDLTPQG